MFHTKFACILIIIISGCFIYTESQITIISGNKAVNGGYVNLGSVKYVKQIEQIADKKGYNQALNKVMADVDKHGDEIDKNEYNSNLRLYKLISYLVSQTGIVSKDVHYFRNKLNRAPKTLVGLLSLDSRLPSSKRWKLLTVNGSLYHMQGKDGIYNLKFISADGFCEAVYNKYGILLTEKNDPVNMGTFNFAPGIKESKAHQKYDVNPYLKWGNSPDSPQKGRTAIIAGLKQAEEQCNLHSTAITAYRDRVMKSYTPHKL